MDKKIVKKDEVLAALELARSKIASADTWIQGALRRTLTKRQKEKTGGNYLYAYCAIGAVNSATKELGVPKDEVVKVLADQVPADKQALWGKWEPESLVIGTNDTTDHATVMGMFDRSIEILKEQVDGK